MIWHWLCYKRHKWNLVRSDISKDGVESYRYWHLPHRGIVSPYLKPIAENEYDIIFDFWFITYEILNYL